MSSAVAVALPPILSSSHRPPAHSPSWVAGDPSIAANAWLQCTRWLGSTRLLRWLGLDPHITRSNPLVRIVDLPPYAFDESSDGGVEDGGGPSRMVTGGYAECACLSRSSGDETRITSVLPSQPHVPLKNAHCIASAQGDDVRVVGDAPFPLLFGACHSTRAGTDDSLVYFELELLEDGADVVSMDRIMVDTTRCFFEFSIGFIAKAVVGGEDSPSSGCMQCSLCCSNGVCWMGSTNPPRRLNYHQPFSAGDIVGCGINASGDVYWTHNGTAIGSVAWTLMGNGGDEVHEASIANGECWPTCCFKRGTAIRCNFSGTFAYPLHTAKFPRIRGPTKPYCDGQHLTLDDVPREILSIILRYVATRPRDTIDLSCVSRRWLMATQSNVVWHGIYLRMWGTTMERRPPDDGDWKRSIRTLRELHQRSSIDVTLDELRMQIDSIHDMIISRDEIIDVFPLDDLEDEWNHHSLFRGGRRKGVIRGMLDRLFG